MIEFGDVIDIPDALVAMYKLGGASKKEAISTLMHDTLQHLKAITTGAPDYATLMVCYTSYFSFILKGGSSCEEVV